MDTKPHGDIDLHQQHDCDPLMPIDETLRADRSSMHSNSFDFKTMKARRVHAKVRLHPA